MWYHLTRQWEEMENERGRGEQTWIPNFEEVNMKNYGYFQIVSFQDMYNYNYLKQRSHWEHANIRSMHLQKFWVVYWQPLLIWNVARRNTLFWISGHWNIFKRLLRTVKRTNIKIKKTLLNKISYLESTHEKQKQSRLSNSV